MSLKHVCSCFFCLLFTFNTFAQKSTSIEKVEQNLRKNLISGRFHKTAIDLDNDGNLDYIFTYDVGESGGISVYMNTKNGFDEVISEYAGNVEYKISGYDKGNEWVDCLYLSLLHCCGESPFRSNRTYIFEKGKPILVENYVDLADPLPRVYSNIENQYLIDYVYEKQYVILEKDYNLRYFPSTLPSSGSDFSLITVCEDNTNIIAQIKEGSKVQVIAETASAPDDRRWLLVEVESKDIIGTCNPVSFDFEGQKLRGWISDKYTIPAIN